MKKIILSIILFFNLNFSYADNNTYTPPHVHEQCRSREVGQEAGSTAGTVAGITAGIYVATQIGITGCVATGWWTAGVGCLVSAGSGALIGLYLGNLVGEEIGELFCEDKGEVLR